MLADWDPMGTGTPISSSALNLPEPRQVSRNILLPKLESDKFHLLLPSFSKDAVFASSCLHPFAGSRRETFHS